MITVPKAFIYLTRQDQELLLLAHPKHPEAGLQIPAGTVEFGETPERAARRELTEETGLFDFEICRFLGEATYDMRPFGKNQQHHRFFFHANLTGTAPARWQHAEHHGGDVPIPLELFWWNLSNGSPNLIAGHGDLLHLLSPKS